MQLGLRGGYLDRFPHRADFEPEIDARHLSTSSLTPERVTVLNPVSVAFTANRPGGRSGRL